ncbi:alpha-hydroxy acid oxidase [Sphingobium sp.]|uniref:alpha-hydroxy acid oxidase n=1 Tax=Sphingobium sp. TaxID=1912891 RepID=UPI0028BF4E0B|nr:alpha-hydroxy acid oxidase [Sphingobium sp.]
MASTMSKILSVQDAQELARRRLPASLYQYLVGGSGNAKTQDLNLEAFDDTTFNTHVAVYNEDIGLETTVLGHKLSMPVLTAPTGNNRMLHRDGEAGIAAAAADAGIISCHSSACGHSVEQIGAAAKGNPFFFQLYFIGDRDTIEFTIERAKKAGCAAIILTVDTPGAIPRERLFSERRDLVGGSGLSHMIKFLPQVMTRPAWAWDYVMDGMQLDCPMGMTRDGTKMDMFGAIMSVLNPSSPVPAWSDIGWIKEAFGGPVIVKGIQNPQDARKAVDVGASAIVVSNHGGMSIDGTPGTMRMLPAVLDAVGNEIEVLLDGGIRRGSDVVKAIALGARAVLIGHAYLYAHAAAGSGGVRHLLELFRRHIDQTLRYVGCPAIAELDREFLFDYPRAGEHR